MEKRTIAVIGAGMWGQNLVRVFNELGALRTICDTDETVLAHCREVYPSVQIERDLQQVLKDPEVSGIAIATPAATHAAIAREAVLAGKDVFVEKPLALSVLDAREVINLAAKHERILMVGHLLWYHPAVVKLKQLVETGELGNLQYIYSHRLNLGRYRQEENVLWSFAPHDISVILGLVGQMPQSVFAQGGNYLHQDIADVSVSLLKFAAGVEAHLFVSWLHPFKRQQLVVIGEKAMVAFDDTAPWSDKLRIYTHTLAQEVEKGRSAPVTHTPIPLPESEPLRLECEQFLESMKSRKDPCTNGQEGLRVLQVIESCQTSAQQGVPVVTQEVVKAL